MSDKVVVCFTGTGNSYYVAKALCAGLGYDEVLLGPNVLDHPELLGNPLELGVVFPTNGGKPCRNLGAFMFSVLARPEFDRLQYFFAVTTYGAFPGHSLKIAEQLAMDANILCSYLDGVRMPDTYVPMLPIASLQKQREVLHAADEKIRRIVASIQSGEMRIPRRKPFTRLAYRRYQRLCQSDTVPMVRLGESCDCRPDCARVCEKVCPRDAITIVDGRPQFSETCDNCLACYHFCPRHAIVLDKTPRGGYTYYTNELTGYDPDYRN